MEYTALLTFAHIFIAELNIKWSSCVWERYVFIFELSSILSMLQGLNATSCESSQEVWNPFPSHYFLWNLNAKGLLSISALTFTSLNIMIIYGFLWGRSMEENSNMINNIIDTNVVSVKRPVSKMLHVLFQVYHG